MMRAKASLQVEGLLSKIITPKRSAVYMQILGR